ncbi:MAG: hypothetical protein O2890_10000 [Cyanobacteria bacterium]|nr:hypothetical protein [Cyanobacteriota bacterium]
MARRFRLSSGSQFFLGTLAVTTLVWILRGLTILAFIPGLVLWILLLCTVGAGVVASLQRMR